ncbi:hypothetical protein V5799_030162, partial [Amblyomma americanum]
RCAEDALDKVPLIVADVADEASLLAMAKRTRLVLNTVGPYRFFGRQVVKACVDSGTHHIDISGEPQYLEQMRVDFHDEASEKGVVILSACGFDSIPAEMCLSYMRQHFHGVCVLRTFSEAWAEKTGIVLQRDNCVVYTLPGLRVGNVRARKICGRGAIHRAIKDGEMGVEDREVGFLGASMASAA